MHHGPPSRGSRSRRHRRRRTVLVLTAALAVGAGLTAAPPTDWFGGQAQASALPTAWPAEADGFASVAAMDQNGTYGGRDGETVTVTTEEELIAYATAEEPYTIRVAGPITYANKGDEIEVASDKTIVGVGTQGEIIEGGFFLGEGVHNVIIRNLTIRDTYDGDWDGKSHDWDAIQMDGAHHVWIDHNHLTHMADGLIDSRKDTTNVTVSWNKMSEHNKAFGIGWTENVTADVTMHHNWLYETGQRNPSADNLAHAHLYNNYLQDDPAGDVVASYGNYARGATRMVLENSYFEGITNPYYPDEGAELRESGSVLKDTSGRADTQGEAFDPSEFYDYTLDPAEDVPDLLREGAGPQPDIGTEEAAGTRGADTEGTAAEERAATAAAAEADITVAAEGDADFASVQEAIDAVPDGNEEEVTIGLEPGTYRETVHVPSDKPHIRLVGNGSAPAEVTIVYDNSAGTEKPEGGTYGTSGSATVAVEADDFQASNLTFANDFDEVAHADQEGHQAVALRTKGDRIRLENIVASGDQDTLLLDGRGEEEPSRVLVTGSTIQGNVDFIFGGATAVISESTIEINQRPDGTSGGYLTAPSTASAFPGFLITDSTITGDSEAGCCYLGRPWYAGGNTGLDPQTVIRDSELDAVIMSTPWTDMSGHSWKDARFAEYRNTGAGSGAESEDRPQLSDEEAASHEVEDWLGDWTP